SCAGRACSSKPARILRSRRATSGPSGASTPGTASDPTAKSWTTSSAVPPVPATNSSETKKGQTVRPAPFALATTLPLHITLRSAVESPLELTQSVQIADQSCLPSIRKPVRIRYFLHCIDCAIQLSPVVITRIETGLKSIDRSLGARDFP